MITTATKPRAKRAQWQPHLLPIVPPTYITQTIYVDHLPPNSELRGEPPDNDIVESVRMIGIVDPITVRASWPASGVPGSSFVVDDGGRRIKAARHIIDQLRAAGQDVPEYLTQIPARLILDMGDVGGAAIALQKHATRRRNKVAEYERVKSLVAAGASEADIHAETRMTKGQIRELLRLDTLLPDLLAAAGESRISWGQAHDIAALPESAQERLADILAEAGRIKADEIARERVARRQEATTEMPWDAIAERPSTTGAAEPRDEEPHDNAGHATVAAIREVQDGALRAARTIVFEGKTYWVRVEAVTEATVTDAPDCLCRHAIQQTEGEPIIHDQRCSLYRPQTGDSGASSVEPPAEASEAAEPTPHANGTARARPERIKPCPHGVAVDQCQEQACRRRWANTVRMRAKRGIVA